MIVECPKCKSTFKVDRNIAAASFFKFKCSICYHIWDNNTEKRESELITKKKSDKSFKYLLILNIIIIIITIAALVFYKDKLVYIDEFWRELYNFFLNLIPIK